MRPHAPDRVKLRGARSGRRRRLWYARLVRPGRGLLLLVPLLVAALAPGGTADPPSVVTELVRLGTADGREAAGALHAPAGRPVRGGIVLVHGYGGNFYSGPTAELARVLAERGYAALAVNLRDHDGGPKTTLFEDLRWDVQAAVDALARGGVAPLAILGHSLGTNTVLAYVAEAGDPRVRALVLLAPVGNAFEWNVRQFGRAQAERVLDEALRRQREGRGRELMVVDLGPLGKALYSADHLVSLRGPGTRSDPARNVARVTVPLLLVSAGDDRLVDRGTSGALRAAASAAPRADLIEVPGADHAFSRSGPALADAVERWLAEVLPR